jgi:hypothetical protein
VEWLKVWALNSNLSTIKKKKKKELPQSRWHRPIIQELGRLRQDDPKFNVSLSYYTARSCFKKKRGRYL